MLLIVPDDADIEQLRSKLFARWVTCVDAAGGFALAEAQSLQEVQADWLYDACWYVVSGAVRQGSSKGSMTARDLAEAAARGGRQAAWRFAEYAAGMSGRRQVSVGGCLSLSAEEAAEAVLPEDDEVCELDQSALRYLDRSSLLAELIGYVGRAVGGRARRVFAYKYLAEHLPGRNDWGVNWDGHEEAYYALVDPDDLVDDPGDLQLWRAA